MMKFTNKMMLTAGLAAVFVTDTNGVATMTVVNDAGTSTADGSVIGSRDGTSFLQRIRGGGNARKQKRAKAKAKAANAQATPPPQENLNCADILALNPKIAKLQGLVRQKQAKKFVEETREKNAAATKLQGLVRQNKARAELKKRKDVRTVQNKFRQRQAKAELEERKEQKRNDAAATMIQNQFRQYKAKAELKNRKEQKRNDVATMIQNQFRQYKAKAELENRKVEAKVHVQILEDASKVNGNYLQLDTMDYTIYTRHSELCKFLLGEGSDLKLKSESNFPDLSLEDRFRTRFTTPRNRKSEYEAYFSGLQYPASWVSKFVEYKRQNAQPGDVITKNGVMTAQVSPSDGATYSVVLKQDTTVVLEKSFRYSDLRTVRRELKVNHLKQIEEIEKEAPFPIKRYAVLGFDTSTSVKRTRANMFRNWFAAVFAEKDDELSNELLQKLQAKTQETHGESNDEHKQ